MTDQQQTETDDKTMTCECGQRKYFINFNLDETYAVCASCGRRSNAISYTARQTEPRTVTIDGLGEVGETFDVDQNGRVYIGSKYAGETVRFAFEVLTDEDK